MLTLNSLKAIFITTTNIFDKSGDGGSKASRQHFELLKRNIGEDNILVIMFLHDVGPYHMTHTPNNLITLLSPDNNMKLLFASFFGCRVYMPWEEHKIKSIIDNFNPDLLFLDFSIAGRLLRSENSYKTICFYHNVEADYVKNKVITLGPQYLPAYFAAKINDIWALNADVVMCFNKRDSNRLGTLYGREADYILPVSLEDRFCIDKCISGDKTRLLFLGSCFGPNIEGIEWFINEVMPKLKNVVLDIVGLGFERKRNKYSKYPNVNVIGSSNNIDEFYYSHPIVVMPIQHGAGMKVKTAEAMMFGRTIIATDEALEGYDVSNTDGIYRCNTAEDFIKTINLLFSKSLPTYQEHVRSLFLAQYNSSVTEKLFAKIVNTIMSPKATDAP